MKMGIRILLGLFGVFMAAAVLASLSLAARTSTGLEKQTPDVSFVDLLKKMDKNYDNRISKAEWTGNEIWFAIYDKDRNGILVQGEYESVTKDYLAYFDQGRDDYATNLHVIDTNRDGKISASEFAAYPNPFTQQPSSVSDADKNKDGFISEDEFAAWFAFEGLKAQRGLNPPGPGQPLTFDDVLRKMDKNGDKRIAVAEWTEGEIWFAIYDTNHNGFITRDEFDSVTKDYQQGLDQGKDEYATDLHVIDTNRDGKISASEFAVYPNPFTQQPSSVSSADKNKDGFISEDEFAAWFAFEYLKARYGLNKK